MNDKVDLFCVYPDRKEAFICEIVIAPTASGVIGIKPRHMSFSSVLNPGKIIFTEDGKERFFETKKGGLVMFNNKQNRCTLIIDHD